MNRFSVEERNLISIFSGRNRTEVMADISMVIPYLEDNVLLELSKKAYGKLESMSDEEFEGLEIVASE